MRARPGALSLSKGALLAVLLTAPLLASCSPAPAAPPTPATPPPMSSTPELAAKKKAAGIVDCPGSDAYVAPVDGGSTTRGSLNPK